MTYSDTIFSLAGLTIMKILASTVFSSTLMAMSVAASTSGGASKRTPVRNTLQCSVVQSMVRCVV